MAGTIDIISCHQAVTLDGLLRERVRRTPDAVAYQEYDAALGEWGQTTWRETYAEVGRWQAALRGEGLEPGDRVGVMVPNGRAWVCFEQAALGLGLVVVPLYCHDRAGNIAHVLGDANVRALLLEDEGMWGEIKEHDHRLDEIECVISLAAPYGTNDDSVRAAQEWLPETGGDVVHGSDGSALATIVYSSGTGGPPKGIMLSHDNILSNTWCGLQGIPVYREDLFLSFLPLSHMLERTVGYYVPMMAGARVAFSRSISELANDLGTIRPTVLVSVPRIYERAYERMADRLSESPFLTRRLFDWAVAVGWTVFQRGQGRCGWRPHLLLWPLLRRLVARKVVNGFGGRLRIAITGGAAMPEAVARTFLALGIAILQGYGLTEASPIVSVNTPEDNEPASVGPILQDMEVRIGEDEEILVRGPSIMMGYWQNEEATHEALEAEGWLHSGDKGRIEENHLYIIGRIKDIIVLDTGEKISPTDMEQAICLDPLIDQALVIGDGHPYLIVLAVLDAKARAQAGVEAGMEDGPGAPRNMTPEDAPEVMILGRIERQLQDFPGYARVRRALIADEPWTVDNDLMTATLKRKRGKIIDLYQDRIEAIYHEDKHLLPDKAPDKA